MHKGNAYKRTKYHLTDAQPSGLTSTQLFGSSIDLNIDVLLLSC